MSEAVIMYHIPNVEDLNLILNKNVNGFVWNRTSRIVNKKYRLDFLKFIENETFNFNIFQYSEVENADDYFLFLKDKLFQIKSIECFNYYDLKSLFIIITFKIDEIQCLENLVTFKSYLRKNILTADIYRKESEYIKLSDKLTCFQEVGENKISILLNETTKKKYYYNIGETCYLPGYYSKTLDVKETTMSEAFDIEGIYEKSHEDIALKKDMLKDELVKTKVMSGLTFWNYGKQNSLVLDVPEPCIEKLHRLFKLENMELSQQKSFLYFNNKGIQINSSRRSTRELNQDYVIEEYEKLSNCVAKYDAFDNGVIIQDSNIIIYIDLNTQNIESEIKDLYFVFQVINTIVEQFLLVTQRNFFNNNYKLKDMYDNLIAVRKEYVLFKTKYNYSETEISNDLNINTAWQSFIKSSTISITLDSLKESLELLNDLVSKEKFELEKNERIKKKKIWKIISIIGAIFASWGIFDSIWTVSKYLNGLTSTGDNSFLGLLSNREVKTVVYAFTFSLCFALALGYWIHPLLDENDFD